MMKLVRSYAQTKQNKTKLEQLISLLLNSEENHTASAPMFGPGPTGQSEQEGKLATTALHLSRVGCVRHGLAVWLSVVHHQISLVSHGRRP